MNGENLPDSGAGRRDALRLRHRVRRARRRASVASVRLARRARRRAPAAARHVFRRLEPHLPALGGAALLALVLATGLWSTDRWPWQPLGHDLPAEDRVCAHEVASLPVAPREVRFAGAFADRTPAGEARVRLWESILLEHHAGPFREYLDRVRRYEGWIRPELARRGVPEDFLYLAVIESGLNPAAHSPMGAVGPWQFVSFTAREQGLRMTWAVDERRDPVASTAAAARYLARLRWAFGDWALAAAAYNAGPRRVGRALRRCGCDTFWELMETRLLAGETRDFVPKLIAAARIGSDPLGHGMSTVPAPVPLRFREVEVDPTSRLEAVARAAGTELAEIRRLNPHLRRGVTPARRPSRVRIPPGSAAGFRTAWSAIPEGERRAGGVHVVERRETLSGIARQHGVSVRALLAANDRLDPRRLRPGQRIRVPAGAL